ncbi:hypothetical protein BS78_08G066200 [Paspalum vaginatum]|nr:hypothetical protein BS78_08G066200 [Paspalum vaginatum]
MTIVPQHATEGRFAFPLLLHRPPLRRRPSRLHPLLLDLDLAAAVQRATAGSGAAGGSAELRPPMGSHRTAVSVGRRRGEARAAATAGGTRDNNGGRRLGAAQRSRARGMAGEASRWWPSASRGNATEVVGLGECLGRKKTNVLCC